MQGLTAWTYVLGSERTAGLFCCMFDAFSGIYNRFKRGLLLERNWLLFFCPAELFAKYRAGRIKKRVMISRAKNSLQSSCASVIAHFRACTRANVFL